MLSAFLLPAVILFAGRFSDLPAGSEIGMAVYGMIFMAVIGITWCSFPFRRRDLSALCVIFLVASVWIFRPIHSPNTGAISTSLSELREPYQSIETSYFLDGGSVGIRIVDAGGREARFCVRADLGDGKQRCF